LFPKNATFERSNGVFLLSFGCFQLLQRDCHSQLILNYRCLANKYRESLSTYDFDVIHKAKPGLDNNTNHYPGALTPSRRCSQMH
jgi:hypothetical protein